MRFAVTVLSIPVCLDAQTASVPLPRIKKKGAVTQMFVDRKRLTILAGELHNSSAPGLDQSVSTVRVPADGPDTPVDDICRPP
jgi:hypothetical protein